MTARSPDLGGGRILLPLRAATSDVPLEEQDTKAVTTQDKSSQHPKPDEGRGASPAPRRAPVSRPAPRPPRPRPRPGPLRPAAGGCK